MTTSTALVSEGFSLILVLSPGGLKESFWVSNNALLFHFVNLRRPAVWSVLGGRRLGG